LSKFEQLVKQLPPSAEGNCTHSSSTFPDAVVQPLNEFWKLVTATVKSNKPDGIDVKDEQFLNTCEKLVDEV